MYKTDKNYKSPNFFATHRINSPCHSTSFRADQCSSIAAPSNVCVFFQKTSLTISSREGGRLWAALQRELVTVGGQVVERQEFPLTLAPGTKELPALAAAGALLLLGVPPEDLGAPAGRNGGPDTGENGFFPA